jgi:hypothetical protein
MTAWAASGCFRVVNVRYLYTKFSFVRLRQVASPAGAGDEDRGARGALGRLVVDQEGLRSFFTDIHLRDAAIASALHYLEMTNSCHISPVRPSREYLRSRGLVD